MKPRLGCVPYLNAKPLIAWFSKGEEAAEVTFEDPSLLGPMVDRGEVDAAIASSFFAVQDASLVVAPGVSISSNGPVQSVRLFSKVPFDRISTLALDSASMTSNHLAKIILAKSYGVTPQAVVRKSDLPTMLDECDCAVLIGDAGMRADAAALNVLDLGEAWRKLTGKPFVWAFWVGRDGLTGELAAALRRAKEFGEREVATIAAEAAQEMGLHYDVVLNYLERVIDYNLTEDHLGGFSTFGKMCEEMGFVERFRLPKIVAEASARAGTS